MRPIKTFLLAVHIEYHWRLIRRWQKQGVQLINLGEPLSSKKLAVLSSRISHHGAIAFRLEKELDAAVLKKGISGIAPEQRHTISQEHIIFSPDQQSSEH